MAGPSDGFFRDILKTVGGELGAGLPELEKRQAAARALGKEVSLADTAVALGLMDGKKLDELGALERGTAPRTPSRKAVPVVPPAPPAAPAPVVAPAPARPAKKRLRDRARMVSSAAYQTLTNLRPGKRRRREGSGTGAVEAPADNAQTVALVAGGLAFVIVLVAVAVLVVVHGKKDGSETDASGGALRHDGPAPPAPPPIAPAKDPKTDKGPIDPPTDTPPTDEERRTRLGMIAATAIKKAQSGDFTGAEERLGALRAAARPEDQDVVDDATSKVKLLRAAADIKKQSEGSRRP